MKNLSGSKVKVASPNYASVLKVLPREITELASSLLPEDLEILAYLIACSPETRASAHHCKRSKKVQCEGLCQKPLHDGVAIQMPEDSPKQPSSPVFNVAMQFRKPAVFECNCFQCYTSYWSRWDSSPDRRKIDEAIMLYEEHIDISKAQKKPLKAVNEKGDKRGDGKGKGRRGQEKLKHKEPKVSAEQVGAAGRQRKTDASRVAIKQENLVKETVVNVERHRGPEESKVAISGNVEETSAVKGENNKHSKKVNPVNKPSTRETRLIKSCRVAPFVGAASPVMGYGNDEGISTTVAELQEDDPSALHRGKKLVSLVANRLWGLWDRRIPERMVEVY